LAHLKAAANRDPGAPQGAAVHRSEVKVYEQALVQLGYLDRSYADGSFGTKTLEGTKRLQKHLGYNGGDADGKPGPHSAKWLSLKTGLYTLTD
jgi:hypothetical protein